MKAKMKARTLKSDSPIIAEMFLNIAATTAVENATLSSRQEKRVAAVEDTTMSPKIMSQAMMNQKAAMMNLRLVAAVINLSQDLQLQVMLTAMILIVA
jgi:hypothetical protein